MTRFPDSIEFNQNAGENPEIFNKALLIKNGVMGMEKSFSAEQLHRLVIDGLNSVEPPLQSAVAKRLLDMNDFTDFLIAVQKTSNEKIINSISAHLEKIAEAN